MSTLVDEYVSRIRVDVLKKLLDVLVKCYTNILETCPWKSFVDHFGGDPTMPGQKSTGEKISNYLVRIFTFYYNY